MDVPLSHALQYFNPHSRKGSDPCPHGRSLFRCYFNPHSRKGSDGDYCDCVNVLCISIHTPARGVTTFPQEVRRSWNNFNPHSRKGSDNQAKADQEFYTYFNPHSRKGSDDYPSCFCQPIVISIHTPARGVTKCKCGIDTKH